MSQNEDLSFKPLDDWTFTNERDSDRGVVELLERDKSTGKSHSRMSTLDHELDTRNNIPHGILFTTTKALETWATRQHRNYFPSTFWPVVSKNLNGTFGCEYHRDEKGKVLTHDSWSCFKVKRIWKMPNSFMVYDHWTQLAVFVRHNFSTSTQLVMFINCPDQIKSPLRACMSSIQSSDPYSWHAAFARETMNVYDQAIWDLRGVVWEVEAYQKQLGSFQPQFTLLHDMARHISHNKEILDVAADTVESIIYEQSVLNEQHPRPADRVPWHVRDVYQQLYLTSKGIRATKLRCISLSERLQNEINLAFNIVSQRNNEASVQMAKSAMVDNTMMKTVAIVSLVYLPGTFVSGIFGMNFFNFDTNESGTMVWSLSDNFWLYWLVTIPLTLTTMAVWLLWFNRDVITRIICGRTSGSPGGERASVLGDRIGH
ncbi:hypothetical protein BDV36DRAFT_297217 [Aspergillus pseudocaelatus]|uniref:Cora-like Mg2+ transporter protein-domain-containing protein n=1 Tax=Aspergillus pseudocaelatus TaxID=1825620 RepID=A0ABQ6WGN8_9EURO|nr:hypothetical protein BDV36DRAFT_297217 [Aspergillus pseudocaelatus]